MEKVAQVFYNENYAEEEKEEKEKSKKKKEKNILIFSQKIMKDIEEGDIYTVVTSEAAMKQIQKMNNKINKKLTNSSKENNEKNMIKNKNNIENNVNPIKIDEISIYDNNYKHLKTSHIIIHLKQCNHQKITLLNPKEKNLQCENCSEKDIFKLCFKGEEYLCDNCVEEENKEEEYDRIYDEPEKRINPTILMVPNAPPVSNRNDSYSESLIRRINNKILRLKNLGIEPANITYQKIGRAHV